MIFNIKKKDLAPANVTISVRDLRDGFATEF